MKLPRTVNLSLKLRMAIAMVGVVAAFGLVIRLFVEQRLMEDMEAELESRATNLASNLAADSVEPILYQDLLALEQVLMSSKQSWVDFEYAFVVDNSRNVLAHTLRGDFPSELDRLNRYVGEGRPQVKQVKALGYLHRDVAVPIYDGQLGVLHLGFRDVSVVTRLRLLQRDIVLLLAAVAFAAALLTFALVFIALRPLDTIASALESFRPGRIRHAVEIVRNDEIGKVATRVNEVTLRLHRAQIALDGDNRLATLGRFSSVLAHEVGNPLASVMTRLELMERSHEERFLRQSLPVIRGQLERIHKLLGGLSTVSRSSPAVRSLCDIGEVVREAAEVLRYDPHAATTMFEITCSDTGKVNCVRDQLFQVVLNLGINAVRAAGPSGSVLFKTTVTEQSALIEVADDGPGVPPELRDRIFEPFYSASSGGTGLGLTISRDLVRHHGGEVSLANNDGTGARFQVRLPRVQPTNETSAIPGAA